MELKDTLEAILFSSQKPLSAKELQDILRQAGEETDGKEKQAPPGDGRRFVPEHALSDR
mgnify:CR=1 FL=1